MRDYGKVHTTFWSSTTIRALSERGRMLALYLMTSPHTTIAGVFRLPDGYVAEDLSWDAETVHQGFAELLEKGFANRCETTKWVWIVKHLEWNPPENPNQRKAAAKCAALIPDSCDWKQAFMRVWGEFLWFEMPKDANGSGTVKKRSRNQKQEQKTGTGYRPPPAELCVDDLIAEGIDPGVARDWFKVREKKKAPLTQTAWDGVKREATAAGMTPAQAVQHAAESNWQGFKASWLLPRDGAAPASDLDSMFRRGQA